MGEYSIETLLILGIVSHFLVFLVAKVTLKVRYGFYWETGYKSSVESDVDLDWSSKKIQRLSSLYLLLGYPSYGLFLVEVGIFIHVILAQGL